MPFMAAMGQRGTFAEGQAIPRPANGLRVGESVLRLPSEPASPQRTPNPREHAECLLCSETWVRSHIFPVPGSWYQPVKAMTSIFSRLEALRVPGRRMSLIVRSAFSRLLTFGFNGCIQAHGPAARSRGSHASYGKVPA
jgi:hypothetical protein